ncbi:MAG: hypothetical protein WD845_02125 [Pirellulales bacterium]
MSDDEHNLFMRPPLYGDDDPSGGWGLALLLSILVAAVAATEWLTLAL